MARKQSTDRLLSTVEVPANSVQDIELGNYRQTSPVPAFLLETTTKLPDQANFSIDRQNKGKIYTLIGHISNKSDQDITVKVKDCSERTFRQQLAPAI